MNSFVEAWSWGALTCLISLGIIVYALASFLAWVLILLRVFGLLYFVDFYQFLFFCVLVIVAVSNVLLVPYFVGKSVVE